MLFFKFWAATTPPSPHFEEYRNHVIRKYQFTPAEVELIRKASIDCIAAYDAMNARATAEARQGGPYTEAQKTELQSRHLERQMYLLHEHIQQLFQHADMSLKQKLTQYFQYQHQNFRMVQKENP